VLFILVRKNRFYIVLILGSRSWLLDIMRVSEIEFDALVCPPAPHVPVGPAILVTVEDDVSRITIAHGRVPPN
jgi:hypothetical protein